MRSLGEWGSNQVPIYLGQLLHLFSPLTKRLYCIKITNVIENKRVKAKNEETQTFS